MNEADWLTQENASIRTRHEKCGMKNPGDKQRWGLAFSGGGIRSSTFCLGMAKSLAKNGLLTRFDYLSTVSGGGYAGSALGRLFQSVDDPAAVQTGLAHDNHLFWWWLRKNGRYLFPAGARDTLFATSTLLRGLTAVYFDLFLLGVLLSCVLVLPHILGMAYVHEHYQWMSWSSSVWWIFGVAMPMFALACTWAYWFSAPERKLHVQPMSIAFGVFGLLVAPILISPSLLDQLPMLGSLLPFDCIDPNPKISIALQAVAEIRCLSVTARMVMLQVALSVPLGVTLAYYAGRGTSGQTELGVARNRLTRTLMLILNATLMIVAAAFLDMGSWWMAGIISKGWTAFVAGGSGLLLLVVAGRAILKWLKDSAVAGGTFNIARLANIAGIVLGVLLLLFCASFVQSVVFYAGGFSGVAQPVGEPERWAAQALPRWILVAVPCFLYVLLTGKNLASLNASSLHNFYRARLTRSYVSVGNAERGFKPNALAEASPDNVEGLSRVSEVVRNDDIPLNEYQPHRHGGPLHLINVCVNQTVDDRTGEFNRDRKGRNMTVSAVGCDFGSPMQTVALVHRNKGDPTLGQWVAISGAAASPGMGSHTSKGLAALFTLCGVRLGYWLDIAEKNKTALLESSLLRKFVPKYAHLMGEILATFPGSDDPHWYVSDGGHFENTGVYALLKREASVIVAADCGADPHYAFGDLNNLVRLARIDFNARITFLQINAAIKDEPPVRLSPFGTLADIASPKSSSFLVMARIDYASGRTGYMIVLKPAMIHTLPLDLVSYKSANPTFPQQTTADQFFDEAQWESYFRLGEELASAITAEMLADLPELSRHFIGQLGTGLATLDIKEKEPPQREGAKFAGEVVKSSLGIGAVAGLLFSLWQVWDQRRTEEATENRQNADAIAKAIEKSFDSNGQLRVSDGGVLFLQNVIKRNEAGKNSADYSLAEKLIDRLEAQCKAEKEAEKSLSPPCTDVHELTGSLHTRGGDTLVIYWPGSATRSSQSPSLAAAPPPIPPHAPVPAPPPANGDILALRESGRSASRNVEIAAKAQESASSKAAERRPDAATSSQKPATANAPPSGGSAAEAAAAKVACIRQDGSKVRVYTEVYGAQELDALNGAKDGEPFANLRNFIDFAAVENVTATAEKSGSRAPYRWSAPTLIYHYESERNCAEMLAAVYADNVGPAPNIRPLPERLKKQAGAIELWVPPGGALKLIATQQAK